MPKNSPSKPFKKLKHGLVDYHREAQTKFRSAHPQASQWLDKRQLSIGRIRQHSHRLLTGATLSSLLLLSTPQAPKTLPAKTAQQRQAQAFLTTASGIQSQLAQALQNLPQRIGHPNPDQEQQTIKAVKTNLGITTAFELEGQRLNHSLGFIGYEQHLKRFPGDSLRLHDQYQSAGIAPGLGAWGYFASSSAELTKELELTEKYYTVVQTLYLPTWEKDIKFLRDWYKYRKVLIVNLKTGVAVVAAIADSGPAQWTGKQFGGSPEVMNLLGYGTSHKGKVLLLFVDDPDNKVPLGPVKAPLSLSQPEII